ELPRLPREPHRVHGEHATEERTGKMAPKIEHARHAPPETLEQERHADVLAALERMGKREEARRGHAVARVGVGAAQLEIEETAEHAGEDHEQHPHHEKRREIARGVVEPIEKLPQVTSYTRPRSPGRPRRRSSSP